jgi:hypothetical protein
MIFVLIGPSHEILESLVQKAFGPDNSINVWPGQWVLSVDGLVTSKDVWARLVTGQDPAPSGMVFPVSNGYFGLAPSSVWEWITAKRQAAALI